MKKGIPFANQSITDAESFDIEKLFAGTDSLRWLYKGFEILGTPSLYLAAPKHLSSTDRKRIVGAIVACTLDLKSVDYTIRRYGRSLTTRAKADRVHDFTDRILKIADKDLDLAFSQRAKLSGLPNRVGLVASGAAIIRLQSSFLTASFLIRTGHNFEAAAVMKLILEQLAWAYVVHEWSDESVFSCLPSKCISKLKELMPWVGEFYGVLNEESHIKPNLMGRFLHETEKGGKVSVRSHDFSPLAGFMYLCLADAYCVVLEVVYSQYLPGSRHTKLSSAKRVIPKTNRPLARKIEKIKKQLVDANRHNNWPNYFSRIFP